MAQQSNSVLRFLDSTHTHTHARARGKTPLNKWSDRRRSRYVHNTQQTQETNIQSLSRIRICDPSNQVASDLRLRPRGHRDRHFMQTRSGTVTSPSKAASLLKFICLIEACMQSVQLSLLGSLSLILSFRYFHSLFLRILLASCLTLFRLPCFGLCNRRTKVGHI